MMMIKDDDFSGEFIHWTFTERIFFKKLHFAETKAVHLVLLQMPIISDIQSVLLKGLMEEQEYRISCEAANNFWNIFFYLGVFWHVISTFFLNG